MRLTRGLVTGVNLDDRRASPAAAAGLTLLGSPLAITFFTVIRVYDDPLPAQSHTDPNARSQLGFLARTGRVPDPVEPCC